MLPETFRYKAQVITKSLFDERLGTGRKLTQIPYKSKTFFIYNIYSAKLFRW